MKKSKMRWKLIFSFLFFILIVGIFWYGSYSADGKYDEQQLSTVEDAVKRAAVSCFAIEGVYPPSVDYMREHYGLAVDEDKFTIIYMVYSSNMMPEIDVLPVYQGK